MKGQRQKKGAARAYRAPMSHEHNRIIKRTCLRGRLCIYCYSFLRLVRPHEWQNNSYLESVSTGPALLASSSSFFAATWDADDQATSGQLTQMALRSIDYPRIILTRGNPEVMDCTTNHWSISLTTFPFSGCIVAHTLLSISLESPLGRVMIATESVH